QRRHGARVFAQRQVARDRDGDEPDQDRRQEHDADGEQEIRPVEVPGLDEVLEREIAVLASKGEYARKNQRQYEKSENHRERGSDKRVRLPVPGRASGFSHTLPAFPSPACRSPSPRVGERVAVMGYLRTTRS